MDATMKEINRTPGDGGEMENEECIFLREMIKEICAIISFTDWRNRLSVNGRQAFIRKFWNSYRTL